MGSDWVTVPTVPIRTVMIDTTTHHVRLTCVTKRGIVDGVSVRREFVTDAVARRLDSTAEWPAVIVGNRRLCERGVDATTLITGLERGYYEVVPAAEWSRRRRSGRYCNDGRVYFE